MSFPEEYRFTLGSLCVVLFTAGVILDLVLVLVLKVKSISLQTWLATKAHPTLIVAGILLTILICWLVSASPVLLFLMALLGGHLFTHW